MPERLEELLVRMQHVAGPYALAELVLAVAFVSLALAAPGLGSRTFERIESSLSGIANNPVRQILAVGALAVIARAAFLPWLGAPQASVHDEQSLLLQARTFAAGRLVNPVHPFWEHFETFHVNQLPAYASAFFPGRGAPLAAGLLIGDHPWIGVWLSSVLMCMAAVWMLQGWVSLPMALLGGVLVVARLGVFSYWVNSYWGGAFTAFGAMLVIGALPRVLQEPRWRHGVLMGLGAAILLTSRPYEGALLCLPVAIALMAGLIKPRWLGGRPAFLKAALPAAVFVVAGTALLLAYNQASTGDPLKAAYQINRQTYAEAPAFLVAPPLASERRGPAYFRTFYQDEARRYERRNSSLHMAYTAAAKLFNSGSFYIGATFTAAFLAGLWACRRSHFLVAALLFFWAGYLMETWNFPHYTAPLYPIVLILTMRGFEWLRSFRIKGKPTGLFLTRAMPAAAIALLALPASSVVSGSPAMVSNVDSAACCAISVANLRSTLVEQIAAAPGRHLVLVRDGPHNPIHFEMVYNEADIDNAKIVWARRLGPARDKALLSHFTDRRVWEFEWQPGVTAYRLAPASPALEIP